MHRYRIVAQISLIFSILNLVLAAPIVVQGIHETRTGKDDSDSGVAQDAAATPKKSDESEAASDKITSPPPSHDAMEGQQDPLSPSGSTSSGYSYDPPLTSDPGPSDPVKLYEWMLERPPRQGLQPLDPPASLHGSASLASPNSLAVSQEISPAENQEEIWIHPPSHVGQPVDQPFLPLPQPALPHWPHPSSSGTLGPSEIQPAPQLMGPDLAPTETNFPPHGTASDGLTPSLEPISGSVPLQHPMPEGLAPSHHSTLDGSPPLTSPSPAETLPDNAEFFNLPDNANFFNKDVMKKIEIAAGVVIVGGAIAAGIVGSKIKHHKHRDYQGTFLLPPSRACFPAGRAPKFYTRFPEKRQ